MDDIWRRVSAVESRVAELGLQITGAVHDITSMRDGQVDMSMKLDRLLASVTTMEAHKPVDIFARVSQIIGMMSTAIGIFSAVVIGVIYLIQHDTGRQQEARVSFQEQQKSQPQTRHIIVDGKKYELK